MTIIKIKHLKKGNSGNEKMINDNFEQDKSEKSQLWKGKSEKGQL